MGDLWWVFGKGWWLKLLFIGYLVYVDVGGDFEVEVDFVVSWGLLVYIVFFKVWGVIFVVFVLIICKWCVRCVLFFVR